MMVEGVDDGRVMVGEAGGREGDGWWRKEVTEKRSCHHLNRNMI